MVQSAWSHGPEEQLEVLTVRKQKALQAEFRNAKGSPHMLTACHCEAVKLSSAERESADGEGERWIIGNALFLCCLTSYCRGPMCREVVYTPGGGHHSAGPIIYVEMF